MLFSGNVHLTGTDALLHTSYAAKSNALVVEGKGERPQCSSGGKVPIHSVRRNIAVENMGRTTHRPSMGVNT